MEIAPPTYPERPYLPPVFFVMVAVVVVINLVLRSIVPIQSIQNTITEEQDELSSTAISTLEFRIDSDASKTDSGYLCLAHTTLPSGHAVNVWLRSSEALLYTHTYRVVGRFSPNADNEWGESNNSRAILGSVSVVTVLDSNRPNDFLGIIAYVREKLIEALNPAQNESRALLAGVLCSYRTSLKEFGLDDVFAKTGLSHLIAVSGSHLALVAALLELVGFYVGVSHLWRKLMVIAITGLYVLLCANPASALRSWLMVVVSFGASLLGRRSHSLSSVSAMALLMCGINPYCACDLGFLLSVISVCALSIFGSYLQVVLSELMPHINRAILQALSATLLCQFATLPLCISTFGKISIIAPLANCIIGPLFSAILVFGVLGALLLLVSLAGTLLISVAELLCFVVIGAAHVFASIPFCVIALSSTPLVQILPYAVMAAIWLVWPRVSGITLKRVIASAISCVLFLVIAGIFLAPAQIVMLDVGQGDAILVRKGPHAVLIDTGPKGELSEALARQNIYYLDAVVLTHLHDDHIGGLEELQGFVMVGTVYVARGVKDALTPEQASCIQSLTGKDAQEISVGNTLAFNDFTFEVLWPKGEVDGLDNEDSLCMTLTYKSAIKMLFTGDAEQDSLAQITNEVGDIDVLKVGHHGSSVSINEDEALRLKPEISIISAGKDNYYGHPTQECLDFLKRAGSVTYCTKDVGDISIKLLDDSFSLSTQQ